MRILLLCHEYPPVGGGAAAVCAALGESYHQQGHDITAITMGFDDLPARETIAGVALYRVPCGRRSKTMASAREGLRWANTAWKLADQLHREQSFDVTHAHFIMPAGIIARRLKRHATVPYLITPHGSDVPGYNHERLKLVHRLVRPWWKRILADADAVVSPSRDLLDLLEHSAAVPQGMVIPNGFEPGRFTPEPKQPRMLLCSRLVKRKGFDLFLKAIADMDLPGWSVDIVGDGPQREHLQTLARQCRIPVKMHGWIDNTDPRLARLFGQASLFILPSMRENFSIALLEAMSAGCAVITTHVSGNPEAIGDTGLLIPPNDADALRQAVLSLAEDPPRRKRLGDAALTRAVEQFNWQTIARRYAKVLEHLTTGQGKDAACASA